MVEKPPKEIVVKFDHLNPKLQQIIYHPLIVNGEIDPTSINQYRTRRLITETVSASCLAAGIYNLYTHQPDALPGIGIGTFGIAYRIVPVFLIQASHEILLDEMNHSGLIQTKFEVDYEEKFGVDRLTPASIGKKRPIFYVKRNGDLVFVPENRMEYARYKFQQMKAAKLGINPWRWRAYLRPPDAPQSVKKWANDQVNRWSSTIQSKLKGLKPAVPKMVPVHARLKSLANRRRLGFAK